MKLQPVSLCCLVAFAAIHCQGEADESATSAHVSQGAFPPPSYKDGVVLNDGLIVPIYWGTMSATVRNNVPDFYAALERAPIYDWLHEYRTVHGQDPEYRMHFMAPITITPDEKKKELFTSDIEKELILQMSRGVIPYRFSAEEMAYVVHLPKDVLATAEGSVNCGSNCGFHYEGAGTVNGAWVKFPYSVVPDFESAACGGCAGLAGQTLNSYTFALSHELIEMKTNPLPLSWPGWSEVADICERDFFGFRSQLNGKTYTVQKMFSLAAGKCVDFGPVSPLLFDTPERDSRLWESEDWAWGFGKAECSKVGAVVGISVKAGGGHPSRVLCEDSPAGASLQPNRNKYTVHDFSAGSDRADTRISWALGTNRGECGANEAVTGLAQSSDGLANKILCRSVDSHALPKTCKEVRVGTQQTTENGNWDQPPPTWIDNPKGECSGYVKGVSRHPATGDLRSLLCCTPNPTAVHGDVDGDGIADLAFPGASNNNVTWVLGNGSAGYWQPSSAYLPVFSTWAQVPGIKVVQGDFDGNHLSDLALLGYINDIPVAFSQGNQFTQTDKVVGVFAEWARDPAAQAVPGDFNGDGRDDIMIVGGANWSEIPYARSEGNGNFTLVEVVLPTFAFWASLPGIKAEPGDFNGDGLGDVALLGFANIPVALSDGDHTFNQRDITSVVPGDFSLRAVEPNVQVATGDFDGDGSTDFVALGGAAWSDVPVALSNHNATFRLATFVNQELAARARVPGVKLVAGDFDRDGKADIILVGGSGQTDAVLGVSNGDGSFTVAHVAGADLVAKWAGTPGVQLRSGF